MMSTLGQIGGRICRGEVSVNFVGRKRLWYAMSGLIVLISIVALLVGGVNFSVDFKGGAVFTFPSSTTSLSQVQTAVDDGGVSGAIVQQLHGQKNGWQVQTKALTGDQTVAFEKTLSTKLGVNPNNISVTTVGPSWGSQISGKAIEALIAFMIVIVLYLSIAFEWKMAIAAFIALVHDLVIATGVYALAGFQVSPATVIGLLTILGYSLYDTVVVFDKMRETTAGLLRGAAATSRPGEKTTAGGRSRTGGASAGLSPAQLAEEEQDDADFADDTAPPADELTTTASLAPGAPASRGTPGTARPGPRQQPRRSEIGRASCRERV